MLSRVHLTDGLSYAAFRVDHISDAFCVLSRRVITRTIGHSYFAIRIAEQPIRETEFFGECPILFFRIKADAKNLDILIAVLLDSITESITFSRSARGIGFRVKP
jgi:hypothetical protein